MMKRSKLIKEQKKLLAEIEKEVPEGVCCCCGHKLSTHIDEGDGWRCHSLGQDFYQCECFLRKGRYASIEGYDLKKRLRRYIKEEKLTEKW